MVLIVSQNLKKKKSMFASLLAIRILELLKSCFSFNAVAHTQPSPLQMEAALWGEHVTSYAHGSSTGAPFALKIHCPS